MTKLVLALFCALLVAIFAVQNAGTVVVGFSAGALRFPWPWYYWVLPSWEQYLFSFRYSQQISRGRRIKEYRNRIKELEVNLRLRQKRGFANHALAKETA